MKKMVTAVLTAGAVLVFAAAAMAAPPVSGFEKDMTAEEWAAFKSSFLSKKPTAEMQRAFPGCNVCTGTPVCRTGYKKVGYTEMVNYVVTNAWGADHPNSGGYVAMMSKTINQNGMCVHDHVEAATCNKL